MQNYYATVTLDPRIAGPIVYWHHIPPHGTEAKEEVDKVMEELEQAKKVPMSFGTEQIDDRFDLGPALDAANDAQTQTLRR